MNSSEPTTAKGDGAAPGRTEPHGSGSRHDIVQRRESRNQTNWIAMIRLLDGTEIPCNVKDVSVSGAKLGVPAQVKLPDTFMLKVVGRNFVCLVRLAWRNGNYAGVRIERVGKLPSSETNDEAARSTQTDGGDYKTLGTSRGSRISSF